MLFSRKALGLEINHSGIHFALLGGSQDAPRLECVAARPLSPGTFKVSLREQNIHEPQHFIERIKEAYAMLLHRGNRLSLTLPDGVGRIMLLDVEGRFKSRSEGLDVIRWKLKKNLPFDISDTHLDYQMLKVNANGEMSLLVALVSHTVISQYEELVVAAGCVPARIELNAFSLCRAFEQRLSLLDEVLLISFYDNTLSIMEFSNGVPSFLRIKELFGVSAVDSRAFIEINNSLLVFRERFPERLITKVACIAEPDMMAEFCDMATEATGVVPLQLEVKRVIKPTDSSPADQQSLFPYTAAIGAALRSL